MEALLATSFDRYARYNYTYRLRTELLPPGPLSILDVGDPYGTLSSVFADDLTVSVDLFAEGAVTGRAHQRIIGSGFVLPFPSGAFDLVTSHDVLEHVPAEGRSAFIDELLRVSAGPVVLCAPFTDPRTSACERIVNAYYVAHVGNSLEPLDEHADFGLPDVGEISRVLTARGVEHLVYSDGWLFHWLAFMLLKAHYVSMGAAVLDRATDRSFNRLLREVDGRPPHYRRALILRPPHNTRRVLGEPHVAERGDVAADIEALEELAWDMMAALVRGEDPSADGSRFQEWLSRSEPVSDDRRLLESSLRTALSAAREEMADSADPEEDATRVWPTVTAVVLHREGDRGREVAAWLGSIDGVDDVVLCSPPHPGTTSRRVRHVTVDGDDALQLAGAIGHIETEAMLVVDPAVDVTEEHVRALLSTYDLRHPCVGFHRTAARSAPQAAGLRTYGAAAPYVCRELFLVQRDLYRGVGGLDGRFQGQLDDVDLGWRLNMMGYTVTSVGAATWDAPAAAPVPGDIAVLWFWIKNFDLPTLDRVLPGALLSHLVRQDPDPRAHSEPFGVHLGSLLDARADVARSRMIDDERLRAQFGDLTLASPIPAERRRVHELIEATFVRTPVSHDRRVRLLAVADESTHKRLAALARLLEHEAEVIVATPHAARSSDPKADVVVVPMEDVPKQIEHADVVVVSTAAAAAHAHLLRPWSGVVVIDVDNGGPLVHEDFPLERGDAFVCGSVAQRDHVQELLRRFGRNAGGGIEAHELVAVVPTSSVPRDYVPSSTRAGGSCLVLDLAGLPAELQKIDVLAEELGGRAVQGGIDIVVVTDPDGRHLPLLDRLLPVLGAAKATHHATSRFDAIATADVVLRPTPDSVAERLASASAGFDVLSLGAALVTTAADPVAPLVSRYGAGGVVSDDPRRLVEVAVSSVLERELAALHRVGLARLSAEWRLSEVSPLVEVVRRPWRWRWAHAGGLVPLDSSPAVQAMLDKREAEVTASLTAALTAEMDRQVSHAAAAAAAELTAARQRLAEMEDELNRARHDAHRLRNHPLFRAAILLKRLLHRS